MSVNTTWGVAGEISEIGSVWASVYIAAFRVFVDWLTRLYGLGMSVNTTWGVASSEIGSVWVSVYIGSKIGTEDKVASRLTVLFTLMHKRRANIFHFYLSSSFAFG